MLNPKSFRNPHFGKWNFELMIVYPDKPFGERQSGIPCSVSYCTLAFQRISHFSPLTSHRVVALLFAVGPKRSARPAF
jgi:hypothetical protein